MTIEIEKTKNGRWLFIISLTLAIILGTFTGWADFNNDEPQSAVIFLLVFGFIVGALHPKRAWLWGLILGLSIPAVYLIAIGIGYQPAEPPEPGWYASLIGLIPAFLGTYAGVSARKFFDKVLSPSPT